MNKISLRKGRINQKNKTRTRILDAAKALMSKDKEISLEDVAQKAKISRATIYRYFPSIELLCSEASLDIHVVSPERLHKQVADFPLEEQILFIQNYYTRLAQDHEMIFRRYLSAVLKESITTKKKIRGARRVEAMNIILDPFKNELTKNDLKNLKNISTILMGVDPLIVAKDVCGLTNEESNETLKWAIEMILKGIECTKS